MDQSIPSHRPFLKVVILVSILILGFWIASFFPDLVLALIIAGLISFILKPLVKFLEFRTGLRRSLSVFAVMLFAGSVLVLVATELLPLIFRRLESLLRSFQNYPFEQKIAEAVQQYTKKVPFVTSEEVSAQVHSIIASTLGQFVAALKNFLTTAVTLSIIPFVTYFILAEGDKGLKKVIERVPNKYFEMTLNVISKIEHDLIGYLRGWILDSIIIGLLSIAGYFFIGVEYPIVIGVIAGVANLIPYLGPVVGAVPAFLVSLTQFGDARLLIPIIAVTLIVQAIDNTVVQPLCFAKTVDMHPLTVILALIIGNQLMGIAGMLLAIPLTTILKVSAEETYWGLRNYRITC